MENVGRRMVEIAEVVVPSVSAKETQDRRESGESIVILDVREPDEWAEGHIEGAVLLSRGRWATPTSPTWRRDSMAGKKKTFQL